MPAKIKQPPNPEKRAAILEAALDLFAEYGFHGTAVPQVAQKARVGAGTVYRYFASKEALVNELYQEWRMRLGLALVEDFPVDRPIRAQFHELWHRLARFGTRHPKALDFLELHHHGSYLDEESITVEKKMLGPPHVFAEEAQRQELVKPVKPEVVSAIVWGAFTGLVQSARKGYLRLDEKTLAAAEECLWEAIRR